MKILIADDHGIVRDGIRYLIKKDFPEARFQEAKNSEETLGLYQTQSWDLITLDLSMPGCGGMEILKEIRKYDTKTPVLVITGKKEDEYAIKAFQANASGYLTKNNTESELIEAVGHIIKGNRYVTKNIAEKLVDNLQKTTAKPPHELLSTRELEILKQIAAGNPPKKIAKDLQISINSVQTYRNRILAKLKMTTSAQLTNYAIKNLEPICLKKSR